MEFYTKSGKFLSKIGIGTYGIGGRAHRYVGEVDNTSDEQYVEALIAQLKLGMNFSEISNALAQGKSANLFAKAISTSSINREDLFLSHSIYPKDVVQIDDINKDVEDIHEVFNTMYFDSTLVTLSLITKFGEESVISILKELLDKEKTRYISLSNSNLVTIQKFKDIFKEKFFAHEAHLSFEIRENQEEGILDLCKKLGVRNNIWRPLRENKTSKYSWELLTKLSKKYNKTQNQIILNWMISNQYFPMVFSKNIDHIKENFEAQNFEMTKDDIKELNEFRIEGYNKPKVDWDKTGDGISVALLPDKFEENFKAN